MTATHDAGCFEKSPPHGARLPFDAALLDDLLDQHGIDAVLVTSKHNLQYLLGGYRYFFHDQIDAIGISRYLPILVYVKHRAEDSVYIGNQMERYEHELGKFWLSTVEASTWGTLDATERAVAHLRRLGGIRTVGIEAPFLPADAYLLLQSTLTTVEIRDAVIPLERLRARKTAAELELLREASDRVVDAMLAVVMSNGPGASKRALVNSLRQEEAQRGLIFEYCLITMGTDLNRAPSDQIWREGEILSLDSGGNYKGYIGDLCRMAVLGEPDQELQDLLGMVEDIQQAARTPIRAGALGREVFVAPRQLLRASPHRKYTSFLAHGMGLIGHEAPRLTSEAPQAYPGDDADRPLEPGMVISIETTMQHPRRGFIKLEDTLVVKESGWEAFGDHGRGWNLGGGASSGRRDKQRQSLGVGRSGVG